MNMIAHAADNFRETAEPSNRAAQIIVKTCPPFLCDQCVAVLRREHEVIMQAEIGGGHGVRAGLPPGCGFAGNGDPVVSSRCFLDHRLMAFKPPACGFGVEHSRRLRREFTPNRSLSQKHFSSAAESVSFSDGGNPMHDIAALSRIQQRHFPTITG